VYGVQFRCGAPLFDAVMIFGLSTVQHKAQAPSYADLSQF
jgi:hypothetical protein